LANLRHIKILNCFIYNSILHSVDQYLLRRLDGVDNDDNNDNKNDDDDDDDDYDGNDALYLNWQNQDI
jgi:hypothetical protein